MDINKRSVLDEWEKTNNGYNQKNKPYVQIRITQLKKENPMRYQFIVETNIDLKSKFMKSRAEAERYAKQLMMKHYRK